MPIPPFVARTGYLPPGDHVATMDEVEQRFATNRRRREIYSGLTDVVERLRSYGVVDIWLDGSFTTAKQRPQDVDVVFRVPGDASSSSWGDITGLPEQRAALKASHRVDLWKSPAVQINTIGAWPPFLDIKQLFESDLDDEPKGMIRIAEVQNDQDSATAVHREAQT